jgi:hypothetical protein
MQAVCAACKVTGEEHGRTRCHSNKSLGGLLRVLLQCVLCHEPHMFGLYVPLRCSSGYWLLYVGTCLRQGSTKSGPHLLWLFAWTQLWACTARGTVICQHIEAQSVLRGTWFGQSATCWVSYQHPGLAFYTSFLTWVRHIHAWMPAYPCNSAVHT